MKKQIIESLLRNMGITINGSNPWDPQIYDERFYSRVLREGSLGLGESYMNGWWNCQHIDQFIERILKNGTPWVGTTNSKPNMNIGLVDNFAECGNTISSLVLARFELVISNCGKQFQLIGVNIRTIMQYDNSLKVTCLAKIIFARHFYLLYNLCLIIYCIC